MINKRYDLSLKIKTPANLIILLEVFEKSLPWTNYTGCGKTNGYDLEFILLCYLILPC